MTRIHDFKVVDRRFRSLPAHQKPPPGDLTGRKKATEVGGDGWREGGLIQGRGTSSRAPRLCSTSSLHLVPRTSPPARHLAPPAPHLGDILEVNAYFACQGSQRAEHGKTQRRRSKAHKFKIGEALRPFLLVGASDTTGPSSLTLPEALILTDAKQFLATVRKDGFFPSPYSAVPSNDQYTDFAAFSLELSDLLLRYCKKSTIRDRPLQRSAEAVLLQALEFLIEPANFLE